MRSIQLWHRSPKMVRIPFILISLTVVHHSSYRSLCLGRSLHETIATLYAPREDRFGRI